jgi:hypothetical protein
VAELDVEVARWLVSTAGLAAIDDATDRLRAGTDELVLVTRVRAQVADPGRGSAVLAAAKARISMAERWEHTDRLVFTRDALEQASAPEVAAWRARRFAERETWDLCAGCGGDAMALSAAAASLTAVERDPGRAVLLAHNLEVVGGEATVLTDDALRVDPPRDALIHADPARRRDGRRLRRLADHVPPVPALFERYRPAAGMGVVLSPAVDHADPDLPLDVEVEFLQLGGDLVEAVAWAGELRGGTATATATLLPQGLQRSRHGGRPPRLSVGEPGTHLLEVAPAAVRARLHDDIGREIGARRISAHLALLTGDDPPPGSGWYRARPIVAVQPARPKALRDWLRRSDVGPVELVLHGIALDPERWWRELGRPPRGPGGFRLELTRLDRRTVVLVTDDRDGGGSPGS